MSKIIEANFLKSAQFLSQCPAPLILEVAFLGRSNVGKSSIINSLTNRKTLAKSSQTPGKTQLINFFDITFIEDEKKAFGRFVDLPGFGYAKVSKSIKDEWNKNLIDFLKKRDSIRVFIHLIDARHKDLEIDKEAHEFLNSIKRADQIILNVYTKADKLSNQEVTNLKKEGIAVSNLKKSGIDELVDKIYEILFKV